MKSPFNLISLLLRAVCREVDNVAEFSDFHELWMVSYGRPSKKSV